MTTSTLEMYRGRRMGTMKKLILASMAAAVITLPTLAQPAPAQPTGPGVRDGKNIGVFHNLDFIAAFGYPVGEKLTIDVYRGEHKIATAFGPAIEVDEGLPLNGALEVNHGPEGAAVQGDCWENFTPDILPGDRVVVTDSAGGTDEVLVDGISINEEGPIDTDPTSETAPVTLEGRASYADGAPIPIDSLDSGEIRHDGPRFRATPNNVERIAGTEDGWRATYQYPYNTTQIRDNPTIAAQKQAVLNGDHAMGYGHVAPLPPETQLVEGIGGGGPALGCEASPKQANAITISDDESINLNSGPLNLSGTAMEAVSAVGVILSDTDPNTPDARVEATGLTEGPGEKAWSAEFSREQLESLADGELTATGSYTLSAGGETTGANKTFQKDTTAPTVTNDLAAGPYDGEQSARLSASEEGAKIHYTTDGSAPTAESPLYEGPIKVANSQTIKAIAIDKAGNQGEVASSDYVINQASALELNTSSPVVTFRDSATLSGKLSSGENALAGKRVNLLRKAAGDSAFSQAGSQLTKEDGGYSFTLKPQKNAVYRVQFAGEQELKGSTSAAKRVNVKALVINNTATKNLTLGQNRVIAGAVSPAHTGTVKVTIKRGASVVATKNVKLSDTSRYRLVYKPATVGRYSVSVSVAKDADHLGNTSPVKVFRVIR